MRIGRLARVAVGLASVLTAPLRAQRVKEPDPDSLARLVAVDSNDAQLHFQLAMALIKRTRYDDAERALRQSIVVAPHFADAYLALSYLPFLRGEAWWKLQQRRGGREAVQAIVLQSRRDYRRAFLLDPLVDLQIFGRARERASPRRFVGKDGRGYWMSFWWLGSLGKSINFIQDGNYQSAFDTLNAVVHDGRGGLNAEYLPGDVLWYHSLAAAHVANWDEAIHSMAVLTGRAVAQARDDAPAEIPLIANEYRQAMGTLYYLSGRPERAIPVFQRVLELDLGVFSAHSQLARIFEAAGRWDDAIRERQSAVDANPDDPALLTELGATQLHAGHAAEAETTLLAAEHANPRDPGTPYLRALAAVGAGHPEAARDALTRFLAIAPRSLGSQIAAARQQLASLPKP